MDSHANFAYGTVATAPSPAISGTTLVLSANFPTPPTPPYNVTIWPVSVQPSATNAEIARVTANTAGTLTITRAQEGTSARAIVAGDQVAVTITSKTLTDIEAEVGGSSPVNWAVIDLVIPAARTLGLETYVYEEADLTINSQAGSDFSIAAGGPGNHATVVSAAGGRFQASAYMESPSNATLDGGSDILRWLWFGLVVGSPTLADNPFNSAGLDQYVPVVLSADGGTTIRALAASAIGYTPPGGICLWNVSAKVGGLSGADSIPLDFSGPYQICLWQV